MDIASDEEFADGPYLSAFSPPQILDMIESSPSAGPLPHEGCSSTSAN